MPLCHIHRATTFLALLAPIAGVANEETTAKHVRAAVQSVGGIDNFMRELSRTAARSLPQQIDSEWELLGVVLVDRTLSFTHRAYKLRHDEVRDPADMRARLLSSSLSKLCTSPISGTLILEYGVGYRYTMVSREQDYITKYEVTAKQCKAAGKLPPM